MPIVQEAIIIPEVIQAGLENGTLVRFGNVVRRNVGPHRGAIVKHLKNAPIQNRNYTHQYVRPATLEGSLKRGLKQMGTYAANHPGKVALIVCGITVAGYSCVKLYDKYARKEDLPVSYVEFQGKLNAYLKAISRGSLDLMTIDALTVAIEEMINDKECADKGVVLSLDELKDIVGLSEKYSENLIRLNSLNMKPAEVNPMDGSELQNLLDQLETQRTIFAMS